MITVVHNKKEPSSIYIGRPSALGNPFVYDKSTPRGSTIPAYRQWLFQKLIVEKDIHVVKEFNRLLALAQEGDLMLGCWCAPHPCHGDVIKSALEWRLKDDQK